MNSEPYDKRSTKPGSNKPKPEEQPKETPAEKQTRFMGESISWLNAEMQRLREQMGPILNAQGRNGVKIDWPFVAGGGGGRQAGEIVRLSVNVNGKLAFLDVHAEGNVQFPE